MAKCLKTNVAAFPKQICSYKANIKRNLMDTKMDVTCIGLIRDFTKLFEPIKGALILFH